MGLKGVVRRPIRIAAGAAVAAVLVVVPAAHAAQRAPNSGFEFDCGGVPCFYAAVSPASITRDTSTFHGGAASLKLTMGGTNLTGDATSACVTGVQPGSVSAGFWYRSTDILVTSVGLFMRFYTSSNCSTGFISGTGPTANVTADGLWHQRTASTFTVPPLTNSIDVGVNINCNVVCTGASANFDDLTVDVQNVLAVTVSALAAQRSRKGVTVRWRTGTEVDTLGFHVFRQRAGGPRVRVNAGLIPPSSLTRGTVRGSYSYLDRRAPRQSVLRYWLQEVDSSGHRTWHGPVTVRAA